MIKTQKTDEYTEIENKILVTSKLVNVVLFGKN